MNDPVARLHSQCGQLGALDGLPGGPPRLVSALEAADIVETEWSAIVAASLAAGPIIAVVGLLFGRGLGLSLAALSVAVAVVVATRLRHRGARRALAELPGALDQVVRALRTGASGRQAIEQAATAARGSLARRLQAVVAALRFGQPAADAIGLLVRAGDPRQVRAAAAVLAMAIDAGRGSARAVDSAARSLRAHSALAHEVRALTAQARLSVRVLALLPLGFVGFGFVSGNEQSAALLDTTVGRWCLVVGLGLDLAGVLWMRTLLTRVR